MPSTPSDPAMEPSAPSAGAERSPEKIHVERRLLWRFGSLAAVLVLVGVVGVPLVHRWTARSAFEERARSLAAAVASDLADVTEGAVLAERLRPALSDPDVLSVEALGAAGRRLASVPLGAPAGAAPPDRGGELSVREPVVGGGTVAEVRVTLSTASLSGAVRRTWLRSVLAGMLLLAMVMVLVHGLVRNALAPLRRLSGRGGEAVGGTIGSLLDSIGRRADDLERRAGSLESLLDRLLAHLTSTAFVLDTSGRCVRDNGRPLPGADAPPRPGTSIRKAWEAAGADDAGWAAETHDRCLREGRIIERDVEMPDPRGGSRHASTRWIPLDDVGEGAPGVLLLAEDTTERVRNRVALEEREARLRHAERLEVVGRLTGSVAHDFNNLLTVIVGFNELLATGVPAGSPEAEDLEEIRRAAERGASLTARLLGFARTAPAEEAEPIDPAVAVEQVRGMVERIVGEGVAVEVEAEEGLGRVRLDPVRLDQILLNLASNARDAMPGGGTLRIRLRSVDGDGRAAEAVGLLERAVVISVADTGTGMDQETVRRIFDPFFTTKTEGRGTGLGLATVQEIVSEAGGFVEVESAPGEGTTFNLHLPAEPEAEVAEEEAGRPAREDVLDHRGEHVLVVDDEEAILRLVRRVLEARGYRVTAVEDAREAVRAAEQDPPPALALIDVAMPGLSGPRVAARLRERHVGLKVLFTSGLTEEALQEHGIDVAGRDFLEKPFTPEALAWRVRELLEGDEAAA